MYLIIEYTFQKEERAEAYEKKKKNVIGQIGLFAIICDSLV